MDHATSTKVCNKCHETKLAGEFYAKRGSCKVCVRAQARDYDASHQDSQRAASAAWRETHRAEHRAGSARWYASNRDRALAVGKVWRDANPERCREYSRRNGSTPGARITRSAWRAENPRDPATSRKNAAIYGARRLGAFTIPYTQDQLDARIAFYGGMCWICKQSPYEEIDHVKPLSRGGSHMLANLRPACRFCNSSKNATWPFTAERKALTLLHKSAATAYWLGVERAV